MKNEKTFYEEPIVEVIEFTAEDIITTSGGDGRDPAEFEEIED